MRIIIAVCAVIVIVAVALQYFRPGFFPSLASSVAAPFWRAELSIQLGSLLTNSELLSENEYLKRELADLKVISQSATTIEAENEELKSMMGRGSTTPYTLAAVLMKPPLSSYDEILVDIGADHDVAVGDSIFAPGNVLIGKISAVEGQTSKAVLFSSPGQRYEVEVGAKHAPAVAYGRGGGQYQAQLPRDIDVKEGDFVLSPSISAKPFGFVSSVETDPAQPFETVLFASPVNIYELRWVLVDTTTMNATE